MVTLDFEDAMADANAVAAAMLADLGDETPQVLVLKGPWGCGKSYLWTHHVAPRLTEAKRAVVTTSLFGISSVDELRNRLATGAIFATPAMLKNSQDRFAAIKQVGGGAAKQLGKMLGQALDEYAGTSAFASRVDYLELVPEGVVFCIDDVERAGAEVDVRGVLGVVNYLVEVKKCRVVLIMDDEHLDEKEAEFHRFKERVVRAVYRLEPDLSSAFDRLVQVHLSDKSRGRVDVAAMKEAVLGMFERSEHDNLRTLDRALRIIGKLENACTQALPVRAILFATVLVLDDAVGEPRERKDYEFSVLLMMMTSSGRDEGESWQRAFVQKYFHDPSDYEFVGAIYDAIADGILDAALLNAQLFVDPATQSDAERLAAFTQGEAFLFLKDEEYRDFVERVRALLADVANPLTATEATMLFAYAAFAAERSKAQLGGDMEEHARQHVQRAALSPDESLRRGFEPHLFDGLRSYLRDLLDVYTSASRHREALEENERLKMAIDRCDLGALYRTMGPPFRLLERLTTDAPTLAALLSSSDVRFRHLAIDAVVSKLSELSDTHAPWVPVAKRGVDAAIRELMASAPDNSERSRLDRVVQKTGEWEPVKRAGASATAAGEAEASDRAAGPGEEL